jgi:hypothetical protein
MQQYAGATGRKTNLMFLNPMAPELISQWELQKTRI